MGRLNILSAISDWLKLLALIVLVAEATIIAAMKLTPTENVLHGWYPVIMLLFLLAVVVGFFWDRQVQANAGILIYRNKAKHDPNSDGMLSAELISDDLAGQFTKIHDNVRKAAGLNVVTLMGEVSHELNELSISSKAWSRGELHTSTERYRRVLLELYDNAKTTIFSTTIRDYIVDWSDDLMATMIETSEHSHAVAVTRIFVFANRKEIDSQAIEVLLKFNQSQKIQTYVYIDDEDDSFSFPADISRDFVVIDGGEAIGITVSYGPDRLRAQWYFHDEDRIRRFAGTCKDLVKGSKRAEQILDWWRDEHANK